MDGLGGTLLPNEMQFDSMRDSMPTNILAGRGSHDALVMNLEELLDCSSFFTRFYIIQSTALLAYRGRVWPLDHLSIPLPKRDSEKLSAHFWIE